MRIISIFILSFSLLLATPAYSAWQLDSKKSSLTFVSIKKGTVAENHSFKAFTGVINNSGLASVAIELSSVDTNIAIRNERMAEFLFETATFAQASFSAQLNNADIDAIAIGSTKQMSLKGSLNLHGQQQELTFNVMVAKLSAETMLVTTVQPVIIKAEDFALVAGVNKLKSLASLPSIAYAVPVSFVLTFTQ
ncbi:YceI family protein [Colwellia hornerae]|uniref:YceI family protein n=1 Tax=Colwellia hornerae TaxID=89402 RepID=A0A5C6QG08_9GAMM|nr:YceI family protein [Colwellia hornerae]TWX55225.1 YceI family protein [Colwellia hornerae]TWX61225.1 YceI family protein [Colwellia hornerae]TWX67728.1 YceI family protein [Colwellia hornerae]